MSEENSKLDVSQGQADATFSGRDAHSVGIEFDAKRNREAFHQKSRGLQRGFAKPLWAHVRRSGHTRRGSDKRGLKAQLLPILQA